MPVRFVTSESGLVKILTKNGKVSCSCCEQDGCCMYRADELGVGFQEADLPDSVEINGITTNRIGTSYGSSVVLENGVWALYLNNRTTQQCLIFDQVNDLFADTYVARGYRPDNSLDWEYTLTRQSLCEWQFDDNGQMEPVVLQYNGEDFPPLWKWIVNDQSEWFGIKSGNQNTPVGTYPDAWSLEAGGYIEISA